MQSPELKEIIDWLIDGARSAPSPVALLEQTCERLVAAGVPLWRVGAFVRTLHPDVLGRNFIWRPGAEVVVGTADYDLLDSPEFINSPLAIVFRDGIEVGYRMDDPESKRFPFFDDMRTEGVTGYIALPLRFIDGTVHASSWSTKQPGGFTDAQLTALRTLIVPFARLGETFALRRTATTMLETYVGHRPGERILAGQIRRGHTETMNAAIWLSDLRGFTRLSDRLPSEIVVDILNPYFDCQVEAITRRGGEVLKFMGDGLLAVFPVAGGDGNGSAICGQVLEAVQGCPARVAGLNHFQSRPLLQKLPLGLATPNRP